MKFPMSSFCAANARNGIAKKGRDMPEFITVYKEEFRIILDKDARILEFSGRVLYEFDWDRGLYYYLLEDEYEWVVKSNGTVTYSHRTPMTDTTEERAAIEDYLMEKAALHLSAHLMRLIEEHPDQIKGQHDHVIQAARWLGLALAASAKANVTSVVKGLSDTLSKLLA